MRSSCVSLPEVYFMEAFTSLSDTHKEGCEIIPAGQPVNIFASEVPSENPVVGIVEGSGPEKDTLSITVPPTFRLIPNIGVKGLILIWHNLGRDIKYHADFVSISGQSLTVSLRPLEKRSYVRVKCSLPFYYKIIQPGQVELAAREIMELPGDLAEPHEDSAKAILLSAQSEDKANQQFDNLFKMMQQIDTKLDHLISLFEGEKNEHTGKTMLTLHDLSGSGFSFHSPETLKVGQFLKVAMSFSRFPNDLITFLGQVCRSDHVEYTELNVEGKHLIAGTIVHIREDDRERIIHYVFKVQRKLLRNLRIDTEE